MSLKILCPRCESSFEVPAVTAGQLVRCTQGHLPTVPELDFILTVPEEPAAPPVRSNGIGLLLAISGLLILLGWGACLYLIFGELSSHPKASVPADRPVIRDLKEIPPTAPVREVDRVEVGSPIRDTKTSADDEPAATKLIVGMHDRLDREKLDFRSSTPDAAGPPPVWEGHTNHIRRVAFTNDGQFVVSVSGDFVNQNRPADNSIRVWDARTGRQVHKVENFTEPLHALTISPGGRYALFSHGGHWDTVEGKRTYLPAKSHRVFLWDIQSKRVLDPAADEGEPAPDREGPGPRFVGLKQEAFCTDFSPGGVDSIPELVAAGDRSGGLCVWRMTTGEVVCRRRILKAQGSFNGIRQLKFTPDGRFLVLALSDHTLRVLRTDTGEEVTEPLKSHEDIIWALDVSRGSGGVRALSAGGDQQKRDRTGFEPGARDYAIRLWDLEKKEVVRTFAGHTRRVNGVAFCPDGRRFVSCGIDRTLRLWDLESGNQVAIFGRHDGAVQSVAVSPDGHACVTGGLDGKVRFWRIPAE
jgi:WD40 repeat protein